MAGMQQRLRAYQQMDAAQASVAALESGPSSALDQFLNPHQFPPASSYSSASSSSSSSHAAAAGDRETGVKGDASPDTDGKDGDGGKSSGGGSSGPSFLSASVGDGGGRRPGFRSAVGWGGTWPRSFAHWRAVLLGAGREIGGFLVL